MDVKIWLQIAATVAVGLLTLASLRYIVFKWGKRTRNKDFIEAVRSANLNKIKAMLSSVDGPSRAKLCQDYGSNADGKRVPVLVLAAQLNFKLIARYLLHNGAIPDIFKLYSDDQSQFEANVRKAGWKCAQGLDLAPLILECILFQHGDSLSDESCKIMVKSVGLGTMSVTRDSLLIAAVKKSGVFAQRILDLDPFDHIYEMIMRRDLTANVLELDALNLMHRSPGSEWKNAAELSDGRLQQRILEKFADQERKRLQLLFHLCTVLTADALKLFKYLILPERRDIHRSPGLPKNQGAESLRAWDLFSCKYDGEFGGHICARHTYKKGDTFLHVAARFETDASGAFLSWLLQHASLVLEEKNCEGMEPAQCAQSDAVRAVIERRKLDFHLPSQMSAQILETRYDVFISYRNNTEANFATALHYILSAPPFLLKVYLDKYSMPVGGGHLSADNPLEHGDKHWMVGLYKAMYNSKIILILVSHEGIVAPFAHPTSRTDACLAEHFFANMLDCMRSMFHPTNGMQDCSNIRTVLVGPFPDPFVPLLDVLEYQELQKHIPDKPHNATTDKCLEVVHFCASPRSPAPAPADLNPQRPTEQISNVKFRSTKIIFEKITEANNIRPDMASKKEETFFGKLENIADCVANQVLLIPANYTEPAIEEYAPFIRIRLDGSYELLNEDDVRRTFGEICDAAGVANELNARLKTFFAGSIGLNVEICSAVESPLTCTETIKRFLRAYRSGQLDKFCVLSVEVVDPLQLWPRIIAYERALYGTLDHPEVCFSMSELQVYDQRLTGDEPEEHLSAASASSARAATCPSGLTTAQRAEWSTEIARTSRGNLKLTFVPIAPSTCDSAAASDLRPASKSALVDGTPSVGATASSQFRLTVAEDAFVSAGGSLLCAVKVEKGELCKHAIIRNRDGATAVVKDMVDAAKQKITRAGEGAFVTISLGRVDDSVMLDAKMLKRGSELRSSVALSGDTEKDNEHLLWYKVADRALLPACSPLTVEVFAKLLSGKVFPLTVQLSDTVASVKVKVQDAEGISSHDQRLIFGGVELDDSSTLRQCNVQKESTIHVIGVNVALGGAPSSVAAAGGGRGGRDAISYGYDHDLEERALRLAGENKEQAANILLDGFRRASVSISREVRDALWQDLANTRYLDAAACGCVLQIEHTLLHAPATRALPTATDKYGNSALHIASMHGHADAVLHLEKIIQPGLRNSSGKTAPEVWCSLLPAASSPYPDVTSVQQIKVRRHEEANRLVSRLDEFLKKASDFVGWRKYLSEWKAAGRIDAHANSVMFDIMFKLQDSHYLAEFYEDESLQNLALMFDLLAQFAQESFGLLVQKAQTASVVEQEKQKSALRFLDSLEILFENSINKKILGIEMSVSITLLKNAIRSFPLVVSGGGLTKSQQHLLQTLRFELFLAFDYIAGGESGDSLRHICNLACVMLSEVQACESNDWMVSVCEMNLACIGCKHPDLEKAESSFQILQKHLNKYTSFFTRRFSLLLQGVSALYKVARFSPHPSIRLRAAIGRCEVDSHDSPCSFVEPSNVLNAVTFDNGDTVVLRRSDGTSSTRLRKIPTCSIDDNVWTFPTILVGNNDANFTVTFLGQVASLRKQDAGTAFALVRVQPKVPALSTFSRTRANVDAVEGYFQLQYLAIKQKAADKSRGRTPSPPPPTATSDQRSTVIISIKTLTSSSSFFKNFKNDRVRGYSALMMLRLYHNLEHESSDDPSSKNANAMIVEKCIEAIDNICSSSFNHHLRADLDHLRQLRQPGHAVATAPAVFHVPPSDPIHHAGSGGGAPSALENARLLWQKLHGHVPDLKSPPPAATHAAAVAKKNSAPPMDHKNKAANISPQQYNPQAALEQQHWMPLSPSWQRVCDVAGRIYYFNNSTGASQWNPPIAWAE